MGGALAKDDTDITYCPRAKQDADIFTKGLQPVKWPNPLSLLNIRTDTEPHQKPTAPIYFTSDVWGCDTTDEFIVQETEDPVPAEERELEPANPISVIPSGANAAIEIADDALTAIRKSQTCSPDNAHSIFVHQIRVASAKPMKITRTKRRS